MTNLLARTSRSSVSCHRRGMGLLLSNNDILTFIKLLREHFDAFGVSSSDSRHIPLHLPASTYVAVIYGPTMSAHTSGISVLFQDIRIACLTGWWPCTASSGQRGSAWIPQWWREMGGITLYARSVMCHAVFKSAVLCHSMRW